MLVCSVCADSDNLEGCGSVAKAFAARGKQQLLDAYKKHDGLKEKELVRMGIGNMSRFKTKQIIFISIRNWHPSKKDVCTAKSMQQNDAVCDFLVRGFVGVHHAMFVLDSAGIHHMLPAQC